MGRVRNRNEKETGRSREKGDRLTGYLRKEIVSSSHFWAMDVL